jgi:hypothetical protein
VREIKVETEPGSLAAALAGLDLVFTCVGLEVGPMSQWLHGGLAAAGLPVVLLETRQLRAATRTMPIKTDRTDARAIAPMVRTGLRGLLATFLAGIGWIGFCRSMVPIRAREVAALPGAARVADGTEAAGDQAA